MWSPALLLRKRTAEPPTVLVADDDPALRALVRVTLVAQGWRVVEAANPPECLELARRHRPEVLLLDVTFEGHARDGYSVCRELKTSDDTKETRVVLFTASDDPDRRAFASAVGATAFIVKPFGPLDLVRLLRLVRERPVSDLGIGIYLIEAGVIRPTQLERAVAEQRLRQGGKVPLGEVLVDLGFATRDDVRMALERQRRTGRPGPTAPPSRVRLRVVIADDNASVREGLRELITSQSDLVLVGTASDGAEALRLIRESRPDLVVLDNDMPRLSGMSVLRTVRAAMPGVAVVMFTLDESIRDAALMNGAAAVITKDVSLDRLLNELRRAARPAQPRDSAAASAVLMRQTVSRSTWGAIARRRRAIVAISAFIVAYAGGFLLAEPALGASAAVLAIIPAAFAGALLGSEAGMVTALLAGIVSAALWQGTGHAIGEPILSIGGNGLGLFALMGIGAGFGAMRHLRGRLNSRVRRVSVLAEAARLLAPGLGPTTLALLAEAALDVVPGDAALLYLRVPGGGLELVAATGDSGRVVGSREAPGPLARVLSEGRGSIINDLRSTTAGIPQARSGIVVPVAAAGEGPRGVLAVLATDRETYRREHLQALESYAAFIGSQLSAFPNVGTRETPTALHEPDVIRR